MVVQTIYSNTELVNYKSLNHIDKKLEEDDNKEKKLIPIISVTGTNGKTTTVRLIHSILTRLGYISGLACTGGIFIGANKIESGDTTGYYSAKKVLGNEDIQVAVLETARGGIIRRGIGYEKARVAVLTSISEDHIGMDGINSIEDLVRVKTVVFDKLHEEGKIVCCNNPLVLKYLENKERVSLFSINFDINMKNHREKKGEGMFLRNNHIIYFNKDVERTLVDVRDIPFTHNGFSKSNIKNIMAAIASVMEIHKDLSGIIKVLKDINCDLNNNPGRQNLINLGNFQLFLDYGHNSEAFTEVFNIAKSFKPKSITSIISAPGDRQDKYIRELGIIASNFSDDIVIREHEDLRGRRKGESSRLLFHGVMDNMDFDISRVKVVFREEEALKHALESAKEGELIVLFTQCLNVIIPIIDRYLISIGRTPMNVLEV